MSVAHISPLWNELARKIILGIITESKLIDLFTKITYVIKQEWIIIASWIKSWNTSSSWCRISQHLMIRRRRREFQNSNSIFVQIWAITARLENHVEMPIFTFHGDAKKPRQDFLSLSLNSGAVLRNPTPGEFAYIWQSKWVGIIQIRLKNASSLFKRRLRCRRHLLIFRFLFINMGVRQRSHLTPGLGARVQYSLGTIVNTPFFN